MAQSLYLIRHTALDVAPGVCYGRLDVDVAASFRRESQQVLAWLPAVELVITSPLTRTRKLASYLAEARGCELRADVRLVEKSFGGWEGREWSDIPRPELDAWAADVMGYAPEGGESARQVMGRVQALLHDIAQLPQQSIALVTHGGVIRAALAHLGGLPLPDLLPWELGYGAVVGVKYAI